MHGEDRHQQLKEIRGEVVVFILEGFETFSELFDHVLCLVVYCQFWLFDEDVIEIAGLFLDKILEIILELEFQMCSSLKLSHKTQLKHLWSELDKTDQLLINSSNEEGDWGALYKRIDMEVIHLFDPISYIFP